MCLFGGGGVGVLIWFHHGRCIISVDFLKGELISIQENYLVITVHKITCTLSVFYNFHIEFFQTHEITLRF